jgi:non-heme chloroperoxidase
MQSLIESKSRKSDLISVNGIRLHYIDWGGKGPVLLFLAGMGNSAYIFNRFAPRFTDHFHVMGLTRRGHGDSECPETGYDPDTLTEDVRQFLDAFRIGQVILAGHSMANLELCHFAALHPQRLIKLVFLDAAYDRTLPNYLAVMQKNPLRNIPIPGMDEDHYSMDGFIAFYKNAYVSLAAIWDEVLDEEILHLTRITPEGKVIERMSEPISQALNNALYSYTPENSVIKVPALSIFVIQDSAYYLAPDYMTEEQQAQVVEFIDRLRPPAQRECIEQFRRDVPQARIVIIPGGHHYCFIKHEKQVFDEMHRFLLE